jgi:hypothetical protein
MDAQPTGTTTVLRAGTKTGPAAVPFGANAVRLSGRQWLIAGVILWAVATLTPWLWKKVERFNLTPDYRLPYALSKDYWLYQRRLERIADPAAVVVLGDSVVWGEYVLPDGTLSHFLDCETDRPGRFVNGGVNGLFPLALEGLVDYFGGPLRHRKIILQCNLLWLTSPKADLSTTKEEPFNHSLLVPQFFPKIPCYRADANERLSAVVEREIPFVAWVNHLQCAYYDQHSILSWTLADDGRDPPHYPNCYRFPLAQITFRVPSAPANDPLRGPKSPRHKTWFAGGNHPTGFDWVPLDASLQWRAFQRLVHLLRQRGNDVLVVLGPFNEHMIAPDNRSAYRQIRDGVAAWLDQNNLPHIIPETLPSELYADASHPLTEGYALLAKRIVTDQRFRSWLK